MTWIRTEDQMSLHRKVAPLTDAAFRLDREAMEWVSRNLTDGRIAADEFPDISRRAVAKNAAELVRRGRWHRAADGWCGSETCVKPGPDGWVIHDYLDYNPSKEKVLIERAAAAARTAKWREARKGKPGDSGGDASRNGLRDMSPTGNVGDTNGVSDASPSRPVPSRPEGAGDGKGSSPAPDAPPAAFGDGRPAGAGRRSQPSAPCSRCGNALTSPYHRNVCREEAA